MNVLILGGTTEASELARTLAGSGVQATLSLAGRTMQPAASPIPCRIGGFGGAEGLAAWIKQHRITALIDATHPFAARMPFNAEAAASQCNIPLLSLTRPAWQPEANDNWQEVETHAQAAERLAPSSRVFLTVGRLEIASYAIAPQHFYLARSIDPVEPKPLPNAEWITRRGPFTVESERELLITHRINALITKNSGGTATKAKLIAARELGIPVTLIARPPVPQVETVYSAGDAMAWLNRVHGTSL